MMPLKKKICFVVSSPSTAKVFLLKHFQYLSEKFDIYLVANFEENFKNIEFEFVKEAKNVKIKRGISIIDDAKAILSLKEYFKEKIT